MTVIGGMVVQPKFPTRDDNSYSWVGFYNIHIQNRTNCFI